MPKPWTLVYLLGILISVVSLPSQSAAQSLDPPCVQAQGSIAEQVDALAASSGGLPQDYWTLVDYPEAIRKEIYVRSEPEIQSKLWQEHLRLFLRLDLSPEQRQGLEELIAAVTPEAFRKGPGTDTAAALRAQEAGDALAKLFPRDILIDMVGRLGPRDIDRRNGGGDHES